jgi:hypothetical protein
LLDLTFLLLFLLLFLFLAFIITVVVAARLLRRAAFLYLGKSRSKSTSKQ